MSSHAMAAVLIAAFGLAASAFPAERTADMVGTLYPIFRNPPAGYRSAPLWVWNNRVSEAQIEEQLRDFKTHGIGGVFIHPRPGLITPYLSGEWLDRCAYAVNIGKSLGMNVWIYDENSYPSGFAGGNVPSQVPDSQGLGLRMTRMERLPKPFTAEPLLVLMKQGEGFTDITKEVSQKEFGPGEYRVFDLKRSDPSPWYGGFTYVDIMRREVTEKFLDVTLGAYGKAIGAEFGKTVPGVFQDEAHIAPVGGVDTISYTPGLFDAFRAKWGYDLRPNLPSLYEEVGDWKRVRHNYYALLLDLFINNWAKPYYDYCDRNNLSFTGHYWEHEWPNPQLSPDNMAMAAYAHMPGVDILMNEWTTGPHSQFGNARGVKEIRSAANQIGRTRTMSETYGAGGWDLTFFDQKRIGDWEYVLGVNFLNQHLSYVTIMGARKRDHPQSFSYHEPWWRAYGTLADYFGRLSAAMSEGRQENRILVIEPTTSAWMYASPDRKSPRLDAIGNEFQEFVNRLESGQIEYDLGSEDIMRNHGSVSGARMKVGGCQYELVILPSGMENVNSATLDLLDRYLARGGKVLAWTVPDRVDGSADERLKKLAARYPGSWLAPGGGNITDDIARLSSPVLKFALISADSGILFHHRRVFRDGQLIFLVNTSDRESSKGRFTVPAGAIERWDPFTGARSPCPFSRKGNAAEVEFDLPPAGSLLVCARPLQSKPYREPERTEHALEAAGPLTVTRGAPNVLTIDYCDLTLDGKTERDLYFYDAQRNIYRRHGLPGNPWDSAVQYKTNILDLDRFPPDSGFEASFRFTAAPGVNLSSLEAVIERPELYRVTVNGKPATPRVNAWWLDRAFGVFDIGGTAVHGENTITLASSPFTIHTELEALYVRGDFALEASEKGFTLIPPKALVIGPWNAQGMPFYAEGVTYSRHYVVPQPKPKGERSILALTEWKGSFAEVKVNGRSAGIIAFPPFELDVTARISGGDNRIEVTVYGTLKNTLGPHHNNPPLGMAWPAQFQKGAAGGRPSGSAYSIVGYGLLGEFRLKAVKTAL